MKMSVHLNFQGNCAEAFEFYKRVFDAKEMFAMKYSEAPAGMPVDPGWKDKILHTSIPLGEGQLMGCDAPPNRSKPLGGFQVSVEPKEEGEVKKIYEALKEGGSVDMPLSPTFWSPLFGMCTDKFGVSWMVSLPASS